jgi:hypothetical protein
LEVSVEIPILIEKWPYILFGLIFQYIHGVGARLAYYLHRPGPLLHDLGFELLPVRDAIYSPFFTLGLS